MTRAKMDKPKPPGTVAEIVAVPVTVGAVACVVLLLFRGDWAIACGVAAAYYAGYATAQVFGASERKKPTL